MARFFHLSEWLSPGPLILSLSLLTTACEIEPEMISLGDIEAEARAEEDLAKETAFTAPVLGEIETAVIARVNNRVIHNQDVDRRLDRIAELYRHNRRPFDDQIRAAKRRQVIEALIDRELLRDHIEREHITIPAYRLDQEVEARIGSRFGSSTSFRRYLDAEGISAVDFRRKIRDEIALENILLNDADQPVIDAAGLEEHFERIARHRPAGARVHASTLSLRVPTNADELTRQRIRDSLGDSLDQIETPEAFYSLAERIGQGANTARLARLRWLERHQLHPESARVLFDPQREVGLTTIIDTPLGFEVFWIHERRPPGVRGIDEVEELLRDRARRAHLEKRRRELIQELRREASITVEYYGLDSSP